MRLNPKALSASSGCPECAAKASNCIAFRAEIIRCSRGALLFFRLSKSQTGATLIQGLGRSRWRGSCGAGSALQGKRLQQEGARSESSKCGMQWSFLSPCYPGLQASGRCLFQHTQGKCDVWSLCLLPAMVCSSKARCAMFLKDFYFVRVLSLLLNEQSE